MLNSKSGTFVPNDLFVSQAKSLLQTHTLQLLSLSNWLHYFSILPLEVPEIERIFQRMLVHCKVTKFWEINYKILARILATPKIIAKVQQEDNLAICVWCGVEATLEHILIECVQTQNLHSFVAEWLFLAGITIGDSAWIFGTDSSTTNHCIWIVNFVLYILSLFAAMGVWKICTNFVWTKADPVRL